MGRVERRET